MKLNDEAQINGYMYGQAVDPETLKKAFRLRYDIYSTEYGFEPVNCECLDHDAWDEISAIFVAMDKSGEIVGTVRLIDGGIYGVPMDYINGLNINPRLRYQNYICSEISRLAVNKRNRVSYVAQNLISCLFRYATKSGVCGVLFLTETSIIESYKQIGYDIIEIGDTVFIHGRERTPCLVQGWENVQM